MNEKVTEISFDFFSDKLTLQTGKLAPQADSAVFATLGGTSVLATVVSSKAERGNNPGFLPLTINYEEKLYASGMIKGSKWTKREGRPSDEQTVASRLIDHCVRPLFPKDFRDEVQVVVTVLSYDHKNSPELLAMIAASAALTISPLPFNGPFATVQLGFIEDKLVVNPTHDKLHESKLNMYISYLNGDKVQAMEASINLLTDEQIKDAIKKGNEASKTLLENIDKFAKQVDVKKREYVSFKPNEDIYKQVKEKFEDKVASIVNENNTKLDYMEKYLQVEQEACGYFEEKFGEEYEKSEVVDALDKIQKTLIRGRVLDKGERVDGRGIDDIRPVSCEVNVLPEVHGSAIFNRGLTQGLSIVTLGSVSDSQLLETLDGEAEKFYFHHYVGLGFSTGEPSRISTGRREIGHGMLAENALIPVLPTIEDFPYTIRVVSEILSQNGSSSMASTCGSALSLMDAGVPIKELVGGVSIGLMTDDEESKYVVLTDIQGTEDFSGFMDFKMTGTKTATTAIQMDIKLAGIPLNIFDEIIDKSKSARVKILEIMEKSISKPNASLKPGAPVIKTVRIQLDEIGMVIGSGGKTIKDLEKRYGIKIDIVEKADHAIIAITSKDSQKVDEAVSYIGKMFEEPEIGKTYEGRVTKIMNFGGFVEFLPGKEGLVHVSEITDEYVKDVNDYLKEGDNVKVKLKGINEDGKYVLTMKQ